MSSPQEQSPPESSLSPELALAELHQRLNPGDRRQVRLDPLIPLELREDLLVGAGLRPVRGLHTTVTTVERQWTLPDTVRPDMRLLFCGLNPSPASADSGIGFARPGNRFWPAVLGAGLATRDRDPIDALEQHGLGMTDLVKRTTRKASELQSSEYDAGIRRIDRLATRLQPVAICFVGLAGWRAVLDRRATAGWQPQLLGGRPVYLMPSTSGLNAQTQLPGFIKHLRDAVAGPDPGGAGSGR